jgi:hypothetical protein
LLLFGEALWAIGLNPALWAIDLNPFATLFFQLEQVGAEDKTTVGMAHMEVSLIDLFVICLGRHG